MNRFEKKLKKELVTKGAPTQDGYDELCHRLGITSDYVIGSADSLARPKKDSFFHFKKNVFVLAATLTLAVAIGGTILIADRMNSIPDFSEDNIFKLTQEEKDFIVQFSSFYEDRPLITNNEFFNINILRGYKEENYSQIGYFFFIRSQKEVNATIDFTSNDFQTSFLTKERTYGYINPDADLQEAITMTIFYNYHTSFITFSI